MVRSYDVGQVRDWDLGGGATCRRSGGSLQPQFCAPLCGSHSRVHHSHCRDNDDDLDRHLVLDNRTLSSSWGRNILRVHNNQFPKCHFRPCSNKLVGYHRKRSLEPVSLERVADGGTAGAIPGAPSSNYRGSSAGLGRLQGLCGKDLESKQQDSTRPSHKYLSYLSRCFAQLVAAQATFAWTGRSVSSSS